MLIAIQNWLDGDRDFWKGVKLLEANNGSQFLLTALQVGPNPFTVKKLLNELIKINASTEQEIRPKELKVNTISLPVVPVGADNKLPPDIATLDMEAKKHFKDAAFLHQHLLDDNVATDEVVRGKMAFEILKHEQLWKEKFNRVDYYIENGERLVINELPTTPKVILSDLDKAKLKQRQFNVRSYITKLRAKSWLTGKKLDRAQANLQKYIIELDQINTILNEPV